MNASFPVAKLVWYDVRHVLALALLAVPQLLWLSPMLPAFADDYVLRGRPHERRRETAAAH